MGLTSRDVLVQVVAYLNCSIPVEDFHFWQPRVCIIATMPGCVHTLRRFRFYPKHTLYKQNQNDSCLVNLIYFLYTIVDFAICSTVILTQLFDYPL